MIVTTEPCDPSSSKFGFRRLDVLFVISHVDMRPLRTQEKILTQGREMWNVYLLFFHNESMTNYIYYHPLKTPAQSSPAIW